MDLDLGRFGLSIQHLRESCLSPLGHGPLRLLCEVEVRATPDLTLDLCVLCVCGVLVLWCGGHGRDPLSLSPPRTHARTSSLTEGMGMSDIRQRRKDFFGGLK